MVNSEKSWVEKLGFENSGFRMSCNRFRLIKRAHHRTLLQKNFVEVFNMKDQRERPTSNPKIGLPAPSDQIRQSLRVSFFLIMEPFNNYVDKI